jgi:glycosidase
MGRLFLLPLLLFLSCKDYIGNPYKKVQEARTVPAVRPDLRVEPGNWWTGMTHNSVLLLVRHPELSSYELKLGPSSGVKLARVEKGDSPNYLFVTLDISPKAEAQRVPLIFRRGAESFTYEFPIFHRRAERRPRGVDSRDVVYMLMPDRFANGDPSNDSVAGLREGLRRHEPHGRHGGDLKGIADHLDYLHDLGVTALWLTPELENNQPNRSEHGYAVTDHYRVDPRLGTNEQLRALADSCRRRGMKLIRDVVLNHIGDHHYWMSDLPTRDWLNQWPEFTQTTYRAPTLVDPYASDFDKSRFNRGWFSRNMPDLNQRNPYLARYLIQQAIWWVEYAGLDGFRIDTYTYSDPEFTSRWCRELLEEYPNLGMFGEIWDHGVPIQGFFADNQPMRRAGYDSNLPGVVDFQLMFAIHEALSREQGWTEGIARVYYTLAQDYFYEDPFKNLVMLDNHDFTRFFTVVGENIDKFKSGMAFLLTMRGIPQIYYGTEILAAGSTSPSDAFVRKDFPGGWPGDSLNKFTPAGRTPAENDAWNFTRNLIRYRQATPALQTGKLMQFVPVDGVYAYFRYDEAKTVMVVLNTSAKDQEVDTKKFAERLQGFTGARNVVTGVRLNDLSRLSVAKHSPLVLELER